MADADEKVDMLARLDAAYDKYWGTEEKGPEPIDEEAWCYLGLLLKVARNEIRQCRERLGEHPHHFPGYPRTDGTKMTSLQKKAFRQAILSRTESGDPREWVTRLSELALRAGLPLGLISWSGTPEVIAHAMIKVAESRSLLGSLVDVSGGFPGGSDV